MTTKRRFADHHVDWERLGVFGRLPLFAASCTALIVVPLLMNLIAFYNARVSDINQAGLTAMYTLESAETSLGRDHLGHTLALGLARSWLPLRERGCLVARAINSLHIVVWQWLA